MAKMKTYVIFDSKVEAFLQPYFARSAGEALRSWEQIANDGQSNISRWPADFTLFETAEYDETTGRFMQYEALRSLGTALEVKTETEAEAKVRKAVEPLKQI